MGISCSKSKEESKERPIEYSPKYNYGVITVEQGLAEIRIYNNEPFAINYPCSYVYDYILLRADSFVVGEIYSAIPYQIPAEDKFFKVKIDENDVYLKFKRIN